MRVCSLHVARPLFADTNFVLPLATAAALLRKLTIPRPNARRCARVCVCARSSYHSHHPRLAASTVAAIGLTAPLAVAAWCAAHHYQRIHCWKQQASQQVSKRVNTPQQQGEALIIIITITLVVVVVADVAVVVARRYSAAVIK